MKISSTSNQGFGVVPLLIMLAVVALIATVGYAVFKSNNAPETSRTQTEQEAAKAFDAAAKAKIRAADYKKEGIVTFKRVSYYGEVKRNEIMAKIVDPLIYDHEEVLGIKLSQVTVDINDARYSYDDTHFTLNYSYENESQKSGFIFGPGGRVNYYQPHLCDHGGCKPYPEGLKQKFPANYQAYVACQTVADDKEKQQELGCSL